MMALGYYPDVSLTNIPLWLSFLRKQESSFDPTLPEAGFLLSQE